MLVPYVQNLELHARSVGHSGDPHVQILMLTGLEEDDVVTWS
jgi:hypothetical protein